MDDLSDSMRTKYLRIFSEYLFKNVLNNYWEKVFERRENETNDEGGSLWTEIAMFTDCIKFSIPKMKEGDEEAPGNQFFRDKAPASGNLIFYSVVPNHEVYWDCILSYYLLRKPEIYKSPQYMMKILYKHFEETNCNPYELGNFSTDILKWMDEIIKGERGFFFLEFPIESVFRMKWMLYASHKYSVQQLSDQKFYEEEFVKKDIEAIKKEIEEVFKKIFI